MNSIPITLKLARAAGEDAANRQMRKEGRKAWTVEDFNLAVKTTEDLLSAKKFGAKESTQ